MRILGLLSLLLLLLPLRVQAISFTPEVPVAPPSYGPAVGGELAESIAGDGESYVALWIESVNSAHAGLYSATISADGTVQSPSKQLRTGYDRDASIVWTGDHYLATWSDAELQAIVAAPLASDGSLAGEIETVAANTMVGASNTLAWNGRHALVPFFSAGQLRVALLDAGGRLLRTVAVPSNNVSNCGVAAAGSTFALVWAETTYSTVSAVPMSPVPQPTYPKTNVYLQRLDDDGETIDGVAFKLADVPAGTPQLAIAGNATQFALAYSSTADGMIARVRIDAVSSSIESLPPVPLQQLSGIYWSGDDFVAYGGVFRGLNLSRFKSQTLDSAITSPVSVVSARVAAPNGTAFAIWLDARDGGGVSHVYGALLDADATTVLKGDLPVSIMPMPQIAPALAASPSGGLAVWFQQRSFETADVMAARVDPSGRTIGTAPALLASNVSMDALTVAWLGQVYLVAWTQSGTTPAVAGKRVTAAGVVLDDQEVSLGSGSGPVAVSNGTMSFVAFTSSSGIVLRRLSAGGALLDASPVVVTSHVGYNLAAGSNGAEFVIAWTEGSSGWQFAPPNLRDLYAVRLSTTAEPIDAAPIAVGDSERDEWRAAVASDGRDFLIVYTDGTDIAAKRLLREGSLAGVTSKDEGIVIGTYALAPRVAFVGGRYLVSWSRFANSSWTAMVGTVTAQGSVLSGASEVADGGPAFGVSTALIPFGGAGLLAYSRATAENEGLPRIFLRRVLDTAARAHAVRH
jgi:hypothetical protein